MKAFLKKLGKTLLLILAYAIVGIVIITICNFIRFYLWGKITIGVAAFLLAWSLANSKEKTSDELEALKKDIKEYRARLLAYDIICQKEKWFPVKKDK